MSVSCNICLHLQSKSNFIQACLISQSKNIWIRNKPYAIESQIWFLPAEDYNNLDALCTFISHECCRKQSSGNCMIWTISLCDGSGSVMEREVTLFPLLNLIWWQNGSLESFIELFALSVDNNKIWRGLSHCRKLMKYKGHRLCEVEQDIPTKKGKEIWI